MPNSNKSSGFKAPLRLEAISPASTTSTNVTSNLHDDEKENLNISNITSVSEDFPINKMVMSQDCRSKRPPKGLSQKDKVKWYHEHRCVGVWVQCSDKKCKKWRYLKDILDPLDVPAKWFCKMNRDVRYDKCDKPMCPYYDSSELINTSYTAGSIVWVKLEGYPKWPAMVDDDPEFACYYWLVEDSRTADQYHVVFFDTKEVTRAWVKQIHMQGYQKGDSMKLNDGDEFKHGAVRGYLKRLEAAVDEAESALALTIPDRLKKYSFISRYKGIIYSYKHNIHEIVAKNNLPPFEGSSSSEEDDDYSISTRSMLDINGNQIKDLNNSHEQSLTEYSIQDLSMEADSLVKEVESSISSQENETVNNGGMSPAYDASPKDCKSQRNEKLQKDSPQLKKIDITVEAELHRAPKASSKTKKRMAENNEIISDIVKKEPAEQDLVQSSEQISAEDRGTASQDTVILADENFEDISSVESTKSRKYKLNEVCSQDSSDRRINGSTSSNRSGAKSQKKKRKNS